MQIWVKCSYAHRQVEEQPSKRSQENGDKSAVAMLRDFLVDSGASMHMISKKGLE